MKITQLIKWWRSEIAHHEAKAKESPHRTQKANAQHVEWHMGQAAALSQCAIELENRL